MRIIGYRIFDYTSKNTNKTYPAVNLYVVEDGNTSNGFVGEVCSKLFIPAAALGDYMPCIGDEIDVRYNRWGNIESVSPV